MKKLKILKLSPDSRYLQKLALKRERALEWFSQTRKRHEHEESKNDEEKKEPKRRRSGGEVMEWLKEKGEYGRQLREQELQEKRGEGGA